MAPLLDHRGAVRYFLGCQIDITHLVEDGRGLGSFQELLRLDQTQSEKLLPDPLEDKPTLKALRDFSQMLTEDEMLVLKEYRARSGSISLKQAGKSGRDCADLTPRRRVLGMEYEEDPNVWGPRLYEHSGRLPGVYQNVGSHSWYHSFL